MSKSSYVLRALKILGLEEILKLSEVLQVNEAPLKMAAGEELIAWDDAAEKASAKKVSQEARILAFPKQTVQDLERLPEEGEGTSDDPSTLIHSDLVLWQRQIGRKSSDHVQKKDAFKGYKKSTEMYVVKEPSIDGKDKIRFASTNGVLVNKKQA